MKSFITAITIAVILICGSLFYSKHLENESRSLLRINGNISDAILKDDYPSAEMYIDELEDNIDSFEEFFLATGNHAEIDSIKTNLAELRSFSKGGMKWDALAKTYVLDFLLSHLPENMRLKIGNIL